MADPVVFDSGISGFQIKDTGGDLRNVSDYIVAIDGLPGPRELSDATTLNQTGRKWHPSLQNIPFSLEMVWSDDALVGSDTVFGPLREHTASVEFDYGPEGLTGSDIKYSGKCWVRDFKITTRVGSLLFCRADCQVDGVVARGAY